MTRAQPGRPTRNGPASPPRFFVNVLGPFDVWHGNRDSTPPRGHAAAVVQLLAIHDGRLHRERLVDTLWPDDPPWIGQQRLRNVLSRVRRYTDGLVARDGNLVRFAPPVRIDVTEFLVGAKHAIMLVNTDPHAALEAGIPALMIYRGPLLAERPYADWAYPMRVHVAEQHLLLLEALAHASEQTGASWEAKLYRLRAAREALWK